MRSLVVVVAALLVACNTGPKPTPDPSAAPTAAPAPIATTTAALRLGAPIEASASKVALVDVAKKPTDYIGKTFATTGTVTAVCQHMGCWMELKDDSGSDAHIKMAGHAFFVPKDASGKKARVLATLEKTQNEGACEGEGHDGMSAANAANAANATGGEKRGCRAEAETQLGRPLAKLELVAEGVEIL